MKLAIGALLRSLPESALAGAGLLQFRAHGMQVITGRNDRKQQEDGATQRNQTGHRPAMANANTLRLPAPYAERGHKQQKPATVEKMLHFPD